MSKRKYKRNECPDCKSQDKVVIDNVTEDINKNKIKLSRIYLCSECALVYTETYIMKYIETVKGSVY